MAQCEQEIGAGERCSNPALPDGRYCQQHTIVFRLVKPSPLESTPDHDAVGKRFPPEQTERASSAHHPQNMLANDVSQVMTLLATSMKQTWRATIEQAVQSQEMELARIKTDVALDTAMDASALQMLERALQGDFEGIEPWEHSADGTYRQTLDDIVLLYQPDRHQLQIEVCLTELISAEVRGTIMASGFTVSQVAMDAVEYYYSDGLDKHTEPTVRTETQTDAEKRVTEAIKALHLATIQLERSRAEMRTAIRTLLQTILADAEDQVYHIMTRLVAETRRQIMLQFVDEYGGRVVSEERTASGIKLELELPWNR